MTLRFTEKHLLKSLQFAKIDVFVLLKWKNTKREWKPQKKPLLSKYCTTFPLSKIPPRCLRQKFSFFFLPKIENAMFGENTIAQLH